MEASRELWRVPRFDPMQVHNFLDWEVHLETIRRMKAEGRVRYVGVTTSHGRRHDLAEHIMRTQGIGFVQFTRNVANRDAEAPGSPRTASGVERRAESFTACCRSPRPASRTPPPSPPSPS
jgi:aryl-alcohol dehydrogenase-like predicted oxidoreductase